ncbi:STAS domain-containing protein [Streptomyces galbus]|uniref:STAS domain-containing protein n=1 Tax=Streptomyces galbus TaxID=33898 RepID=A0A4U5X1M2_STRGB|nr:STAS domain-containing protein [Streptomyces galbus]TKT08874.1 STAS domain-containing protein [Streptomyces galbus]GHD25118.1 anti-sigma factor antagonist [Streptomyces galbus]
MPWDEAAVPTLTSPAGGTPRLERTGGHGPHGSGVPQYGRRGAWVIAPRGAYDMDSVAPLAQALDSAVREHPVVVLDASGVTFADSTFLTLLIRAHRSGRLRLVAPSPQVRQICEITGVDGYLDIRDTVDDAVA